jgi:LPXTG-motif cell wall-anchored protein
MKRAVTFLLAAGLVITVAAPASAAPPSRDVNTDAKDAAAWIAGQVTAAGFVPNPAKPSDASLSLTAQAIPALVSAGVGKSKIDAMITYLGQHVDDFVVANGADNAGSLAYLILAATAAGTNPASFGTSHTDLVTRLEQTQQPGGLFGSADPSFDGAFREGLALLALHAVGVANAAGVAWLEQQQCADGSWTAFRPNTAVPCPAVDPATFSGPDTNSTALAVLGLHTQGATTAAANGVNALKAVRNAGGAWGFLARSDQATDANSTGVVLEALRTVTGAADAQGITALLALQVDCTAAAADRGGIAFQPDTGGRLVPDTFATVQATPALAEVALPVTAGSITAGVPTPCAATPPTTSTTVAVTGSTAPASSTPTTVGAVTDSNGAATPTSELPRTGASALPLAILALAFLTVGAAFVGGARRRRT